MFTLGVVQPQCLLPAGQLASAWSSLRSVTQTVARSGQPRGGSNVATTTASDELTRINVADLSQGVRDTLHELGLHKLARMVQVESLNPVLFPENQQSLLQQQEEQSHVSSDSFYENKHGFTEKELLGSTYRPHTSGLVPGPIHLTTRWLPQTFLHQSRGFKTKRSQGYKGRAGAPVVRDDAGTMRTLLSRSVLGTIQPQKQEVATSDRMKSLLADSASNPEVQERLKVSFAEGYAAGQDGGAAKTAAAASAESLSRRLYKFMAVLVIIICVYYIAFPLFIAIYSKSSRLNNIFADTGSLIKAEEVEERFEDVRGADEVKEELRDVVEFLRNPDKFTALGAKLPKGVLLCGPPGIGKTLLARAVAGEAGVPFIYASGSEFDEIFVGVGAKKIRDLFSDAKNRAPCVIFLDEIDAVGSKRVNSETHPYANQTINQLLTEMDGFKQNEGIIILGATNRRDNLDKALMRPGRFDMEVHMQPPDYKGRLEIFELYLSKVKAASDIDLDRLARATSGYTGADIANVVNQAAIRAALNEENVVTMDDLEYARDKITMGPMKKTRIPDEETNKVTAYHEAGHTLVAFYTKEATSPHKVTIMPRGQSLGHTAFIPDKDQYNMTKVQLLAEMDVALGGRVAEELIFGTDKITTGAGSDFQKANNIAEALVKKLGMSEKAGFRIIEDKDFLRGVNPEYSAATMELVDNEIKRLLQESYDRCRNLLKSHQGELKRLSEALLKYETLDRDEIKTILEGKKLVKRAPVSAENATKALVPKGTNKKAIQAIIEGTKLPSTPGNPNPASQNNTAARNDEKSRPLS